MAIVKVSMEEKVFCVELLFEIHMHNYLKEGILKSNRTNVLIILFPDRKMEWNLWYPITKN